MRSPVFQTLTTGALSIVRYDERHLARSVDWLNDPKIVRYSEQRHRTHTMETQAAYWRSLSSRDWYCAVEFDQIHVGNVGVAFDPANGVADVSIMIGARQGQGHGKRAWCAVVEALLPQVRKVTAGTMAINTPMLRLMGAAGMTIEARRERHVICEGLEVDLVYAARFGHVT